MGYFEARMGREKKKETDTSFNSVLANSYQVLVSFSLNSSPWKFAVKKAREHFHPTTAIIAGQSFEKGTWELAFYSHVLKPSCVGVCTGSFIRLF